MNKSLVFILNFIFIINLTNTKESEVTMGNFHNWLRGRRSFDTQQKVEMLFEEDLSNSLIINLDNLSKLFSEIPELVIRLLHLKSEQKAFIVYMSNLVDKDSINKYILSPILSEEISENDLYNLTLPFGQVKIIKRWIEIEQALLNGKCLLFVDNHSDVLEFEVQGWPKRAIEETKVESAIKSSHQGFVETSSENIALIRRYIPSRELKVKEYMVGERAPAKVSVVYLADVVSFQIITELEKRIKSIKIDAIVNSGQLEELIEDNSFSPFPQFFLTERPDAAAYSILQGQIAIIVDRSPGVLLGPVFFSTFFQTIDDYSSRWLLVSFLRLLRYLGFYIAIFLPAIYISLISFHYEVIPLNLLISVGESREKVPYPPLLEALLMEIILEMLREAAIRLPSPISQTVGVVGGIIIGQAAVEAGLVSNIMIIVVALTAVASFILTNQEMAASVRFIRFPLMLLSAVFGIFGIVIGAMIMIIHLVSLKSLGVAYYSPFSPLILSDLKDTVVRLPTWLLKTRPLSYKTKDLKRESSNIGEEKNE